MRRTIFALLILAMSGTVFAEMTDAVDKFTGKREIRYTYSPTSNRDLHNPTFMLSATIDPDGKQSFEVALVFSSLLLGNRSGWRYLSCHNVDWLIDDKPL